MSTIDFKSLWYNAKKRNVLKDAAHSNSDKDSTNTNEETSTESQNPATSKDVEHSQYAQIVAQLVQKIGANDQFSVLHAHHLLPGPPSVYYVPNAISIEEEELLLQNIYNQPPERWTHLKRRRLQNWGGYPSVSGMKQEPLPPFLDQLCRRLHEQGYFPQPPNHVLINEYKRDEGIMPHKDGPLYYPRVVILTLSGPAMLEFRKNLSSQPSISVLAQPRSILVFQDELYTSYFHGIEERLIDKINETVANRASIGNEEVEIERTLRVSLTIRIVPFVVTDK